MPGWNRPINAALIAVLAGIAAASASSFLANAAFKYLRCADAAKFSMLDGKASLKYAASFTHGVVDAKFLKLF